jgi:hypothetical protein
VTVKRDAKSALQAVSRTCAHAAAVADAFAELQRLFPSGVWREERTGAIEIRPCRGASIQWSPREERRLAGFAATFGRFRYSGAMLLSVEQHDALNAYAATVDAPPPAASARAAA